MGNKKRTILDFFSMKEKNENITFLTSYDATFVKILDEAGIDGILVGDSLGMVIQGRENTLEVTVEDIIYHTSIVSRGVNRAHLVADMPFMSYQISKEEALKNAGRLIKEGRAESVKLEGGSYVADTVHHIQKAGIPVMGHIGLTPQSIHQLGGFKIQGRDEKRRDELLRDAKILEEAGAYSVVLEGIPALLAKEITESLKIPTIGVGAGPYCDGQILVIYDLLGMNNNFNPKFAKRYANLHETINSAVKEYISDVRGGKFPSEEHSFV